MDRTLDMDISLRFYIMKNYFTHPNNKKVPAFQAGIITSLEGERVTVVLQGLMGDDPGADDIDLRPSIYKGSQGVLPPIDHNRKPYLYTQRFVFVPS
jgi:hypothetical protein